MLLCACFGCEADMLLLEPYATEVEQLVAACGAGSGRRSAPQLVFASATARGKPELTDAALRLMAPRRELALPSTAMGEGDGDLIDPALVDARGTMPIAALSAASADDADSALVAAQRSTLPATIQHAVHVAPRHKRLEAVRRLMNTTPKPRAALVFVDDARRADLVAEKLRGLGIEATSLSGNDRKDARASLMQNLRDGSAARVVVTTELAARGLDFPMLTHVVNLDLPTDGSHYVHRAGRCGRAGATGIVISICTSNEAFVMRKFARELSLEIPLVEMRGGSISVK